MRDLVPWSGIQAGSPALGAQSLSQWTTGEVPDSIVSTMTSKAKIIFFIKNKMLSSPLFARERVFP